MKLETFKQYIYDGISGEYISIETEKGKKLHDLYTMCNSCPKTHILNTNTSRCIRKTGKQGLMLKDKVEQCNELELQKDRLTKDNKKMIKIIDDIIEMGQELESIRSKSKSKGKSKDKSKIKSKSKSKSKIYNEKVIDKQEISPSILSLFKNFKLTNYINPSDYPYLQSSPYLLKFIDSLPMILLTLIPMFQINWWMGQFFLDKTSNLLQKVSGTFPIGTILSGFVKAKEYYPSLNKIISSLNYKEYFTKFKDYFIISMAYLKNITMSPSGMAMQMAVPFSLIFSEGSIPRVLLQDINKYEDESYEKRKNKVKKENEPLFQLLLFSKKISKETPKTQEIINKYRDSVYSSSYFILNKFNIAVPGKNGIKFDYKKANLTEKDNIIGAFADNGYYYIYYINELGENKTIRLYSQSDLLKVDNKLPNNIEDLIKSNPNVVKLNSEISKLVAPPSSVKKQEFKTFEEERKAYVQNHKIDSSLFMPKKN